MSKDARARLLDLIRDPRLASDVPSDEAPRLLGEVLALIRSAPAAPWGGRRLIGFEQLYGRIGAGRSRKALRLWLWRAERAGRFPARVKLGPATVAWDEAEVAAWLEALPRGGEPGVSTAPPLHPEAKTGRDDRGPEVG